MSQVLISTAASKYFKKLKDKKLKQLYLDAINAISNNPYIGEMKKGDLAGIRSLDIYYNKTNYELAYTVQEVNGIVVVIIMAGTRENFYEQLKRYIFT